MRHPLAADHELVLGLVAEGVGHAAVIAAEPDPALHRREQVRKLLLLDRRHGQDRHDQAEDRRAPGRRRPRCPARVAHRRSPPPPGSPRPAPRPPRAHALPSRPRRSAPSSSRPPVQPVERRVLGQRRAAAPDGWRSRRRPGSPPTARDPPSPRARAAPARRRRGAAGPCRIAAAMSASPSERRLPSVQGRATGTSSHSPPLARNSPRRRTSSGPARSGSPRCRRSRSAGGGARHVEAHRQRHHRAADELEAAGHMRRHLDLDRLARRAAGW